MASNAAAMPPEPARNWRRLMPSFLLASSASSSSRASTRFCWSVCGAGMYSPFEIIRVGTGERTGSATSARWHLLTCSASSSPWSSSQTRPDSFHFALDMVIFLPSWNNRCPPSGGIAGQLDDLFLLLARPPLEVGPSFRRQHRPAGAAQILFKLPVAAGSGLARDDEFQAGHEGDELSPGAGLVASIGGNALAARAARTGQARGQLPAVGVTLRV